MEPVTDEILVKLFCFGGDDDEDDGDDVGGETKEEAAVSTVLTSNDFSFFVTDVVSLLKK